MFVPLALALPLALPTRLFLVTVLLLLRRALAAASVGVRRACSVFFWYGFWTTDNVDVVTVADAVTEADAEADDLTALLLPILAAATTGAETDALTKTYSGESERPIAPGYCLKTKE